MLNVIRLRARNGGGLAGNRQGIGLVLAGISIWQGSRFDRDEARRDESEETKE